MSVPSRDMYRSWLRREFEEVRNKVPREHQLNAAVQMVYPHRRSANTIPAVLLIAATGAGKSLIEYSVMSVLGRIGLVIIPLLVLASDQSSRAADVTQDFGAIHVHHLDEERTPARIGRILRHVDHCRRDPNVSVMLFASPQILVDDKLPWRTHLLEWNRERLLTSIFLDEIQLWLEYALSIREQFITVVTELFLHFFPSSHPQRHVPLCAMTATLSPRRKELFERLTGIHFHQEDILWSSPSEMARRKIRISIQYGPSLLSSRYHSILKFFRDSDTEKIIFYFNSRASAITFKEKLDHILATNAIPVHSVLIHGNLPRQVKAMRIRLFTGKATSEHLTNIRILIATESVAGVGIDDERITEVNKCGISPSLTNWAQILGRLARRTMAENEVDNFCLVFSLDDFAYLFERAYDNERKQSQKRKDKIQRGEAVPSVTPREMRELAIDDLYEMISLLVLNLGCIHGRIERLLGRSVGFGPPLGDGDVIEHRCGDACPVCVGGSKYTDYVRPVHREPLERFLKIDFCRAGSMTLRPKFVNMFAAQGLLYQRIYGLKGKSHLKLRHSRITILQLIAKRMIRCTPKWDQSKESHVLHVDLDHTSDSRDGRRARRQVDRDCYTCELDCSWEGIDLLPNAPEDANMDA